MRLVIFPRGRTYSAPDDSLSQKLAEAIMLPTATRDRLTQGIYRTAEPGNPLGLLHEALVLAQTAEPLEKRLRVDGVKTGRVTALDLPGQIQQGLGLGILNGAEAATLQEYDRKVMELAQVDDFDPSELGTEAGNTTSDLHSPRLHTYNR
jgi:acyl-CoA dehydrogenase